jgi:hypothetical protein
MVKESMDTKHQTLKIRYDGKYDWIEGDARSYTVVSHIVVNGQDLFKFSFTGAANLLKALGLNAGLKGGL